MSSRFSGPSLVDVAALAGVSHQTVSRVVNGHPHVAPATRAKVERAIAELGYRPNMVAKYLAQRRSQTIGVLTFGESIFGPTGTLLAIEEAANRAGYFVGVAPLRTVEGLRRALGYYAGMAVAGLVVVAPRHEVAAQVLATQMSFPTVMVAHGIAGNAAITTTSIDQYQGARAVMDHLFGLGHTDIAFLAGARGWVDSASRERAWREALARVGAPARPVSAGEWTARHGYQAVMAMRDDLPSAIFGANDLIAMGAMRALHDLGKRVPQDVSVAGFDDIDGSEVLIPALTTVAQDFGALGAQVMRLLLAAIDGQRLEVGPVEPVLLVRESTGPTPPARR